MFDILLHGAFEGAVRSRVRRALERTRFRILPMHDPPPGALRSLRVDVAVDCPDNPPAAARGAAALNAELDGPPPVVSVAAEDSAPAARAGGASEVLSPGVDEVTLSSRIAHLASDRARRRRRLVLQGSLDDLGLETLFEAVAQRGHEARIVLRNHEHHATLVVDGRQFLYVRVDGSVGNERALEQVRDWADVHFELWVRPGRAGAARVDAALPQPPTTLPPSSPFTPPSSSRPASSSSLTSPHEGRHAAEVALACAVLNAATAFALASLPPDRVAPALVRSLAEASAQHPGLGGFTITREGRVTAGSVSRAAVGLAEGLARWLDLFLADCERAAPGRFTGVSLNDILGGLDNMVRHAGWLETLRLGRGGA